MLRVREREGSMMPTRADNAPIEGWNPRRHVAGFPIGILCIDSHHPLIPGNLQHAATYSFAPLYGVVHGVDPVRLFSGDPALAPAIVEAARGLVNQGAQALIGACGSFAHYQPVVRAALEVPVCLSILVQIPFLMSMLPASQRLLLYFASRRAVSPALYAACGITAEIETRLVVEEAWELPAFRAMLAHPPRLDPAALRAELVDHVGAIVSREPTIGSIVLQCSDLPPFAADLQQATGRPVYDSSLIAEWLHRAVRRLPYSENLRRD